MTFGGSMNSFLNQMFPNGYLLVGMIVVMAYAIGTFSGVMLDPAKARGFRARMTAVILGGFIVMIVGYSTIVPMIVEDALPVTTYETPTAPTAEMVYTYGSDTPITRVEHERQLAFSATHSPGDDDH